MDIWAYLAIACACAAYEAHITKQYDKLRKRFIEVEVHNARLREILSCMVADETTRLVIEEPPSPYRSWKTPRLG